MTEPREVHERIRYQADGVDVVADVDAVVAVNRNQSGRSVVSRSSKQTIVQRSGKCRRRRGESSEREGER